MTRFRVGDEVFLDCPDPDYGDNGIPSSEFGKRFRISANWDADRRADRKVVYYIADDWNTWTVFETMLRSVTPQRSAGTPYRVVGPDWSGQLFVDPAAASVSQITADLANQCNLHGSPAHNSTEDRIVLGDYTFLRV